MRAPDFWTATTTGAKALSVVLSPLGVLYGASVAWRRKTTHPFRSRARVLCVGNLTAGGTGKTPVALAFAHMLEERGCRVAFLTRGYGGELAGPVLADTAWHTAADVGDEPLLLAAAARTIVARDRALGAAFADRMDIDVIVMDDGLQNFDVVKDASVIVIDSETGFGNGRLIPAGPLREGLSGLKRADAVILMGDGHVSLPRTQVPVLRARAEPLDPTALQGRRVVAFAGIGRPEKFFRMLHQMGAEIVDTSAFPDHHVFSRAEMTRLRSLAREQTAELVTTEKDYLRLRPTERDGIHPVPIHVIFDDEAAARKILDKAMPSAEVRVL